MVPTHEIGDLDMTFDYSPASTSVSLASGPLWRGQVLTHDLFPHFPHYFILFGNFIHKHNYLSDIYQPCFMFLLPQVDLFQHVFFSTLMHRNPLKH